MCFSALTATITSSLHSIAAAWLTELDEEGLCVDEEDEEDEEEEDEEDPWNKFAAFAAAATLFSTQELHKVDVAKA